MSGFGGNIAPQGDVTGMGFMNTAGIEARIRAAGAGGVAVVGTFSDRKVFNFLQDGFLFTVPRRVGTALPTGGVSADRAPLEFAYNAMPIPAEIAGNPPAIKAYLLSITQPVGVNINRKFPFEDNVEEGIAFVMQGAVTVSNYRPGLLPGMPLVYDIHFPGDSVGDNFDNDEEGQIKLVVAPMDVSWFHRQYLDPMSRHARAHLLVATGAAMPRQYGYLRRDGGPRSISSILGNNPGTTPVEALFEGLTAKSLAFLFSALQLLYDWRIIREGVGNASIRDLMNVPLLGGQANTPNIWAAGAPIASGIDFAARIAAVLGVVPNTREAQAVPQDQRAFGTWAVSMLIQRLFPNPESAFPSLIGVDWRGQVPGRLPTGQMDQSRADAALITLALTADDKFTQGMYATLADTIRLSAGRAMGPAGPGQKVDIVM